MSENAKTFYTRIKQKRGTAEYWEEQNQFIPLEGEIIVYTANETEPQKIKIGDGEKTVAQLPFITSNIIEIDDKGGSAITGASFDLENGKIILNKDLPNAGNNTLGVVKSGGVATIDNGEITEISNAKKVNHALKVGAKSYDGSSAIEIIASDLGLSAAMKFLGTSATAITDGATTNPITVGGNSVTVESGNVVLYDSKEFVWNGTAWEELGNEGSYKITQAAVSSPSASGTATAFIDTISQDTNGKITVTKKNIAVATTSTSGLMSAADKIALDKAVEALGENDCYGARKLEGNIVTTESMEGLAIHPVTYIEPKQAGTGDPSPTNVRAISGWNTITATRIGENLAFELVPVGIKDNTHALCSNVCWSFMVRAKPGAYYTATRTATDTNTCFRTIFTEVMVDTSAHGVLTPHIEYHSYDDKTSITFQAPENAKYLYLYVENAGADVDISQYTITEGQVATDELCDVQTITTNLPETIYGGSIDWANGVLTVDSAITNIGSLTVTKTTTEYQTFALTGFTHGLTGSKDTVAAISDTFNGLTQDTISVTTDNYMWFSSQTGQLRLKCASYNDKTSAEFKADFAEAQIVYKIAEPYTIQLTPQQLKAIDGTNSVWSNCGSTEAIFNLTPTNTGKTRGVYYIEGSSESTAGTWLGEHPEIAEYYEGLTIAYKIGIAGASATTLNINNLGAVTVVKNATTAITTSYGVNSIVLLVYTSDGNETYWKVADYDSNTKNTTGTSNKSNTKLFLTGATTQASNATTYSNVNIYIGTDNCLYSNGLKVATASEVAAVSDLVGDTAVSTQISNAVAGKASQKSAQVTLSASGWTASDDVFTQTVTVSSFTGTGNLIVSPEPSSMVAYVNSSVYASNYTGSNITFIATTQPTENLLVNVMVII